MVRVTHLLDTIAAKGDVKMMCIVIVGRAAKNSKW